ncbi:MAG: hypothetical protein JNL10_14715 [Verrucomicrobiales bacterium]|nr:hypothetical protein [Verrucomicrobiales bacterium]
MTFRFPTRPTRSTPPFPRARGVRFLALLSVILLAPRLAAAPVNDHRANHTLLTDPSVVLHVDLDGATLEPGETYGSPEVRRSVWYRWTAPTNGVVLISVAESPNPSAVGGVAVVRDSSPTSATLLAVGDSEGRTPVSAGESLDLMVGDAYGPDVPVTFRLRFVPTPSNDRWTGAVTVPNDGSETYGTGLGATGDVFEQIFSGWPSVWYTWTAPAAGRARVRARSLNPIQDAYLPLVYRGIPQNPGAWVDTPSDIPVVAGEPLTLLYALAPDAFALRMEFSTATLVVTPSPEVVAGTPAHAQVMVAPLDGDIREVEFLSNGGTVASDATPPYEWDAGSLPAGRYTLSARLIRRGGESSEVPPIPFVIRPANDNFAAAKLLEGTAAEEWFHLASATSEPGEPGHVGFPARNSVWWRWTAPRDGGIDLRVARTNGFGPEGLLAVYSGTALDALKVEDGSEYGRVTVLVHAGVTYWIAVAADRPDPDNAPRLLTFQLLPESPNDRFADAIPLTGNPILVSAFAGGASSEPGEWVIPPWENQSLWWSWTAPSGGFLTITQPLGTVDVYSGDRLSSLQPLTTMDCCERVLDVPAGARWYIRARPRFFQSMVGFQLSFTPLPSNDAFASASPLGPLPARMQGELQYASAEPGEPNPTDDNYPHSVWYRWTADASGTVFLANEDAPEEGPWFGSTTSTASVFVGNSVNQLQRVDAGNQTFEAVQGTTYWIGLFANRGSYRPVAYSWVLLPRPSNDPATRATGMPSEGGRVSGYTALSTLQDDPGDAEAPTGGSVWYQWTPEATGFATLTFRGSRKTLCSVFSGAEPATATPVPVMETPTDAGERILYFATTAGVPLWISIRGDGLGFGLGYGGLFELTVAMTDVELQSSASLLTEGTDLILEARSNLASTLTLRLAGGSDGPLTTVLTNAPFRHTFTNLPPGRYQAIAMGTQSGGLPIASPPLSVRVAPTNDVFAQAAEITSLPIRLKGSLAGADSDDGEPILPKQVAPWTRWWTWRAPASGRLQLRGFALFGLYQGSSLADLVPVVLQTSNGANVATVTAGTRYFLQVAPISRISAGLEPDFDFALGMIPENDRFEDRTPVSGAELDLVADHAAAATEYEALGGDNNPHPKSVWFSWASPGDGWLVLEEPTSDPDRFATVFSGDTRELLRRLAASDGSTDPVVVPVAEGARYEILLDERGYEVSPPALWQLRWYPRVANDHFAQRIPLSGNTAEMTGITLGATREPGESERRTTPQNRLIRNTVWYSWTAPDTGWVVLEQDPGPRYVYVEPFEGDTLESLRSLYPDRLTFQPYLSVAFSAEKGHTYAFWVATEEDELHPFRVRLRGPAIPPNDDFAQAEIVSGLNPVLEGTVHGATREPGELDPVFPSDSGTVWYRWKSPGRGVLRSTEFSLWQLSAWKGDRLDTLEPFGGQSSGLGFRTEPGETYSLRVAGNQLFPFRIPLQYIDSPANDDFDQAIRVTGTGDIVLEGSVNGSTSESGESESGVWWRWTAPSNGRLQLIRESEHRVEVFRGLNAAQLMWVPWRETDWNRSDYRVAAGVEYSIRAYGRWDIPARFRLVFDPDPNPVLEQPVLDTRMLRLPVQGTPGRTVNLEQSTDLIHWTPAASHWLLYPREDVEIPISEAPVLFLRPRP